MTRAKCVGFIKHLFEGAHSFVCTALDIAESYGDKHVMEFTRIRVLESSFALVRKGISKVLEWNESHPDFEHSDGVIEKFMNKHAIMSFTWGFSGDLKLGQRTFFWNKLKESCNINVTLPHTDNQKTIIDYEVRIDDGEWV